MMDKLKILVVTPNFRLPTPGACEQDRIEGIKQLKRLGNEVRVIGKVYPFQDLEKINLFSKEFGIPVEPVPYVYTNKRNIFEKIIFYLKRFFWPPYWDGSVYEYGEPIIKKKMEAIAGEWKPEIVWFDYTFMLPLYSIARRHGCKIITHSLIYDPKNLLEEEGRNWFNYCRAFLKTITDYICIRKSDYMFAIAPDEKKMYEKLGAKRIEVLPLRQLYTHLGKNTVVRDRTPLHVFFSGSSYNIPHNLQFAKFIIEELAPAVHTAYPGKFKIFMTGGKLPEELYAKCAGIVNYVGFVEDFESFLLDMDIALTPSLSGTGMNGKIFEPLSRGFPLIMSRHGLGKYPFEFGKEILGATSTEEFVEQFGKMLDVSVRQNLSKNALAKSAELFSRDKSDVKIIKACQEVMGETPVYVNNNFTL